MKFSFNTSYLPPYFTLMTLQGLRACVASWLRGHR